MLFGRTLIWNLGALACVRALLDSTKLATEGGRNMLIENALALVPRRLDVVVIVPAGAMCKLRATELSTDPDLRAPNP